MERLPFWSITDAFGRAPPSEEPGAKMSWRSFVGLLVAEYPLGDLQQAAKLNQRRHPPAEWGLKRVVSSPTEAQCAQPRLVSHAQEIVALQERANGAALAFGKAALGALHEPAAPGIGRRITNGTEDRRASGRREGAASQGKGRLQREPVGVFQPGAVIPEDDGFRAANAIAPRQPDWPGAAVKVDMNLEVSHRVAIRPAA